MKRFLLFGYDCYYPQGADNEVVGSYETLEEANLAKKENKCDCFAILDLQERVWVEP